MKTVNLKLNSAMRATALLLASVSLSACVKGGSITGSSVSSVSGTITLSHVFPSNDGESWTPVQSGGRTYIKGLLLTITGTCTRGIAKVKVHEGSSADYTDVGTCLDDGTWTFSHTYTATSGEGDKTLTLTAYDVADNVISGTATTTDVRIDATPTAQVVVTDPASTPYAYNGSTNPYVIHGTCDADTDHIVGPNGAIITPSGTNWTYSATLTAGATTNFSFNAYDLAGNVSATKTQVIQWVPQSNILAYGPIPGGTFSDASGMTVEASMFYISGERTDSGNVFTLSNGFNYITNKARGL